MKNNVPHPPPNETLLLGLILLTSLEGLVGVLTLLSIPADPKNALLWGYSASRLALLGGIAVGVLVWLGIFIRLYTQPALLTCVDQNIAAWVAPPPFTVLLGGGLLILWGAAGVVLGKTFLFPDPAIVDLLVRLAPLSGWLFLFSLQGLVYLAYKKTEPRSKERILPALGKILILVLVTVSVFIPRYRALDRFATVDEEKWAVRAANFYVGLRTQDLGRTKQAGHPGVTTMWAGTLGIMTTFPNLYAYAPEQMGDSEYNHLLNRQGFNLLDMLVGGRRVLVVVHTVLFLLAFFYLRKILGLLPAFAGILLLTFDPFHLAHSRLLHLDGLLSTFMFVAFLGFCSYLDTAKRIDLFITGITTGMAWLTKSTGLFLIPVFILIGIVRPYRSNDGVPSFRPLQVNRMAVKPLLSVLALAGLTFILFWPAMWIAPIESLAVIFGKALNYAAEGHNSPVFFNGQIYPQGKIGFLTAFYPLTYLWRTSPLVLIGLLAAGLGFIYHKTPFDQPDIRRLALDIVVFVITFGLLINLGQKKFDRYLLPVYLPLDLLSFFGLYAISYAGSLVWNRLNPLRKSGLALLAPGVLLLLSVGQGILALSTAPYFLSYYNPLLGGGKSAAGTMMMGWGEGLDEAARYLDGVQKDTPLQVVSWYDNAFNPFFNGRATEIHGEWNDWAKIQQLLNADYAVVYIDQWQRNMPETLLDVLRPYPPEHVVWINGIEYVRVYNLSRVR
jgi:hypothetical protein